MDRSDPIFTRQEAQDAVAWLRDTFQAIERLRSELEDAKSQIQRLTVSMQSNGGSDSQELLEQANFEHQEAEDAIDEQTYGIVDRGFVLRSVIRGLVDIPTIRDRRRVYLCWASGDTEITYWHPSTNDCDRRLKLSPG